MLQNATRQLQEILPRIGFLPHGGDLQRSRQDWLLHARDRRFVPHAVKDIFDGKWSLCVGLLQLR